MVNGSQFDDNDDRSNDDTDNDKGGGVGGWKKLTSSFGYSYWRMGDEMMLALGQVEKIPCCRSQSSTTESGQQYL